MNAGRISADEQEIGGLATAREDVHFATLVALERAIRAAEEAYGESAKLAVLRLRVVDIRSLHAGRWR